MMAFGVHRLDAARDEAAADRFHEGSSSAPRTFKNTEVQRNTLRRRPSSDQLLHRATAAEAPGDVVGRSHREDRQWNSLPGERSRGCGDCAVTARSRHDIGMGFEQRVDPIIDLRRMHQLVAVPFDQATKVTMRDAVAGVFVVYQCNSHASPSGHPNRIQDSVLGGFDAHAGDVADDLHYRLIP
jgi:hypothetical protein